MKLIFPILTILIILTILNILNILNTKNIYNQENYKSECNPSLIPGTWSNNCWPSDPNNINSGNFVCTTMDNTVSDIQNVCDIYNNCQQGYITNCNGILTCMNYSDQSC